MSATQANHSLPSVLHSTESLKGGIATYLTGLAEHLAPLPGAAKFHVHLNRKEIDEFIGAAAVLDVSTYEIGNRSIWSGLKYSLSLRRALISLEPDILHLHSSIAGFWGRLVVLTLRRPPKIIYCPHGWAFDRDIHFVKKITIIFAEKLLATLTEKIICISDFERSQALKVGIKAEKLHTIYNGIAQIPSLAPEKPEMFKRTALNFVFVGRFDHQKGVDIFVALAERFSELDASWFAVGDVVVDSCKDIQDFGPVQTIGWKPRSELLPILCHCSAVIMPSRWEGFGLVAVEAMQCGTPVIVSNRGALPELVAHGQVGLVYELEKLDEAVLEFINMEASEILLMGVKGRQRYLQMFTSQQMGEATRELYESIGQVSA